METLFYYDSPQVIMIPQDEKTSYLCNAIPSESANFMGCLVANESIDLFRKGKIDLLTVLKTYQEWGLYNIPEGGSIEEMEYLEQSGEIPAQYLPDAGFTINHLDTQ